MNEDLILSMAQPSVKDGSITYEQFENIYDMLSLREQYTVLEILYRKGITLVDENEQIDEDTYILETDEVLDEDDIEGLPVLYDEGLFKDSYYLEDDEENPVVNRNIRQSNEILCTLIQQGNKQAAQDLCVKNKKLVDKYVVAYQKRYGNRLDFEDLEQVGFIGLIKAARKFEIHQGNAFSTYAVWWIKQAISREIMDNGYAIRIPVHKMERINKVIKVESLYIGLSIEERIKKISGVLHMSEEVVREYLILRNNFLSYASLNAPIGDEEDMELGEIIPEEGILSVEDIVIDRELRRTLEVVMSTLTQREQKILRLRFGLDDGRARTLEEVGEQFNVTRERIRQIEAKALRKLRHPSRARKVKDYLD
ncbi:MAG: sigma-70 family RNA polymerase sigma factor [Lachnospiraceae bacterium]|nr:sigma-70 family RNA polymerase sigma factor [Lachnospiraceae bacterium]